MHPALLGQVPFNIQQGAGGTRAQNTIPRVVKLAGKIPRKRGRRAQQLPAKLVRVGVRRVGVRQFIQLLKPLAAVPI